MGNDRNDLEEPDVTPLINLNLVMLVMVLAIAAHAARLLPLDLPAAEQPTLVDGREAVRLVVEEDNTYSIDGQTGLSIEAVTKALEGLGSDRDLLLSMSHNAKYSSLVKVLDEISAYPSLRVAFGRREGPALLRAKPKPGEAGGT
jgi:biopolymer transport protein ExbD